MPTLSVCRLCGSRANLQESHILPAFVFRWQKKTSSTGYLRFGRQMNRRSQDGAKTPLLCGNCEGKLSDWEASFAAQVFIPFHEQNATVFNYDGWMLKFCASVSWRVLAYLREQGWTAEMEVDYSTDIDAALRTWADFLLDRTSEIDAFDQHLIPFGPIKEANAELPPNIQRYLMRAVEIDRIWTQQSAFTFAKMGRFILIGFIREPEATCWEGTRINVGGGEFACKRFSLPSWLGQEVSDRADRIALLKSRLSPRQREVIHQSQKANRERALQSEDFRALVEDIRLRQGDAGGPHAP
jgi:hypothetical protein